LRTRGFDTEELVKLWDVKSIGCLGGMYANRILMPTVLDGVPVSWQTRTVKGESVQGKYLTAPPSHEAVFHKTLVYGMDYAKRAGMAVVVEGVMDVWKLGPGAVHTFGVQWGDGQVKMLAELERVFVMYDNEEDVLKRREVRKSARALAYALTGLGVEVECVWLDKYHDAGDMPLHKARRLMSGLGFPVQ
jgi:hypothetical protein